MTTSSRVTADPALLARIRSEGFAVIPGFLSENDAAALRAPLQACIDADLSTWGSNPHYIDANMVHNLMLRGHQFVDLLENPVMHAYLDELLGSTCILYAYTSSSLPPNGTNYSHRIHVDCPRVIPGYITNVGVMVILDDFTDENGATYFLPKSFERLDPPSQKEFFDNAVRVYPKRGDGVIFNARTWHVGGLNSTNEPRHAITMNVCRSYMRQRFDYPRMVTEQVLSRLGSLGRRFLGFNVRVPTNLDEYYVPAEERLYLPNQG